jgi:hypothetical protein
LPFETGPTRAYRDLVAYATNVLMERSGWRWHRGPKLEYFQIYCARL